MMQRDLVGKAAALNELARGSDELLGQIDAGDATAIGARHETRRTADAAADIEHVALCVEPQFRRVLARGDDAAAVKLVDRIEHLGLEMRDIAARLRDSVEDALRDSGAAIMLSNAGLDLGHECPPFSVCASTIARSSRSLG